MMSGRTMPDHLVALQHILARDFSLVNDLVLEAFAVAAAMATAMPPRVAETSRMLCG